MGLVGGIFASLGGLGVVAGLAASVVAARIVLGFFGSDSWGLAGLCGFILFLLIAQGLGS